MVQVTVRDDAMMEWLGVVRMADTEAIRYALAGLAQAEVPVSVRRANQWVERMVELGWAMRTRPTFRDASIVWATAQAIGKAPPSLFRATTRHEVAVASVSARYLFHGFSWTRDRRPVSMLDHQGDGVATRGNVVDLIEVELSAKRLERYRLICESHARRLVHDGFSRIVYLGTAEAIRTVDREADKYLFRTERQRLIGLPVFESRGGWKGDDDRLWAGVPDPQPQPMVLPGWDGTDGAGR
jgi:hypothetical protein